MPSGKNITGIYRDLGKASKREQRQRERFIQRQRQRNGAAKHKAGGK